MKTQVALLLALSALALTARADNFQTSSNQRVFKGSSQSEAVNACQADRSTNNFDCEQNAQRFSDDRSPQVGDRRPMPGPQGPGHGHGGGYGPQPPPPPPPQPQPYQHVPNGSYLRSCRNAEMDGSVLSAVCKNLRGRRVYSELDLNRCQPRSDIGNNNGQLDCAPRY